MLWKQTIGFAAIGRDIPTIRNGYCVSNAVDYAKKKRKLDQCSPLFFSAALMPFWKTLRVAMWNSIFITNDLLFSLLSFSYTKCQAAFSSNSSSSRSNNNNHSHNNDNKNHHNNKGNNIIYSLRLYSLHPTITAITLFW